MAATITVSAFDRLSRPIMHFGKHLTRRERVAGGAVDAHLARVQHRGRLGASYDHLR